MSNISSAAFADTKPHYNLLDGLRGVAALMVMWYHIFEGFATSPIDQNFNHGYLAVDFFFVLSGFVVGYAYDDRWNKTLTMKGFFKRRLIRLHPMIILGAVLGLITFMLQGSVKWDGTHVATSAAMLAMLCTLFLIPAAPGANNEIRGNGEMFPINGPYWSLFFEYIGNILYALFIHRISTKALATLTAVMGVLLASFAIGNFSGTGSLGVGWSMCDYNFPGGMLRMMFSYSAGMLLSRIFRPTRIRGAFWLCSAIIVAIVCVPHIGGEANPWINGIYDSICVILVFPCLVWLAASGQTTDKASTAVCRFLGDISYPLYVVQYPIMYLFYSWLWKDGLTFQQAWPVALGVYCGNILLAYLCLKLYDEPVRKWLRKIW